MILPKFAAIVSGADGDDFITAGGIDDCSHRCGDRLLRRPVQDDFVSALGLRVEL